MKLWSAVLEIAIDDALGDNLALKESSFSWIYSDNQENGSFLWIATSLGIDPERIRAIISKNNLLSAVTNY